MKRPDRGLPDKGFKLVGEGIRGAWFTLPENLRPGALCLSGCVLCKITGREGGWGKNGRGGGGRWTVDVNSALHPQHHATNATVHTHSRARKARCGGITELPLPSSLLEDWPNPVVL